jgi:MFS family permease
MKKTLVLGLFVQGVAGIMSGLSHSYPELAFFRVVSGVGGSVFIAVGTAAMVVWFREKDVTLALGITGGAAFSAGAAFALYVWLYVQRATSWHTSLVLAGVFELLVMVVTIAAFQVPDGEATGLMLMLAAVGGFFIPIAFGHLVPRTSFDTGWIFLAIVSFAFALLGLAGRNPATASARGL